MAVICCDCGGGGDGHVGVDGDVDGGDGLGLGLGSEGAHSLRLLRNLHLRSTKYTLLNGATLDFFIFPVAGASFVAMAQASKSSAQAKKGANSKHSKQLSDNESEFSEESMELIEEIEFETKWVPEHVNEDIPVPKALDSFKQWSKTVVTMAKYREKHWSFAEIAQNGCSDPAVRKYLSWLMKTYSQDVPIKTDKKGKVSYGPIDIPHGL